MLPITIVQIWLMFCLLQFLRGYLQEEKMGKNWRWANDSCHTITVYGSDLAAWRSCIGQKPLLLKVYREKIIVYSHGVNQAKTNKLGSPKIWGDTQKLYDLSFCIIVLAVKHEWQLTLKPSCVLLNQGWIELMTWDFVGFRFTVIHDVNNVFDKVI